jgi:hypothetical protein
MYDGKRKLSDAVMTFNTARTLHESPLKGYEVVDGKIREGKNKLEFKQGLFYRLQWLGIGFLGGVLLVLAIWGVCSMMGGEEEVTQPNTTEELKDNTTVETHEETPEGVDEQENTGRGNTTGVNPDRGNSNRSMTDGVNRTQKPNAGGNNTNNRNANGKNNQNANGSTTNTQNASGKNNQNAGGSTTNNKNAGK